MKLNLKAIAIKKFEKYKFQLLFSLSVTLQIPYDELPGNLYSIHLHSLS